MALFAHIYPRSLEKKHQEQRGTYAPGVLKLVD